MRTVKKHIWDSRYLRGSFHLDSFVLLGTILTEGVKQIEKEGRGSDI